MHSPSSVVRRAAVAGFALIPLLTYAQVDSGAYLAGSFGVDLQNSRGTTTSTKGTAGSADGTAHFGTGVTAMLTPGLALNNSLRTDLELGYRDKPAKSDGISEQAYTAIANVWVDVLHQYGYFIYFGGGLGGADLHLHTNNGSDSSVPAVWQVGGGAGAALTSHWEVSADFRRLSGFSRSKFDLDNNSALKTRLATNAVTLSLRYSFGSLSTPLLSTSDD